MGKECGLFVQFFLAVVNWVNTFRGFFENLPYLPVMCATIPVRYSTRST